MGYCTTFNIRINTDLPINDDGIRRGFISVTTRFLFAASTERKKRGNHKEMVFFFCLCKAIFYFHNKNNRPSLRSTITFDKCIMSPCPIEIDLLRDGKTRKRYGTDGRTSDISHSLEFRLVRNCGETPTTSPIFPSTFK